MEDSLPIIGFIDPATGVWLARRLPVGVQEMPWTTVETVNALPTIVRGVLWFGDRGQKTEDRGELLDVSGRKAMSLRPGANDISRLPAGVYFLCLSQAGAGSERACVRKVVIQR